MEGGVEYILAEVRDAMKLTHSDQFQSSKLSLPHNLPIAQAYQLNWELVEILWKRV
jgi:hypothetical protein